MPRHEHHEHHEPSQHLRLEIDVSRDLERLLWKLIDCSCNGDGKSQSPSISAVHGRSPQVAQVIVVPKLLDIEKVLLSTMPRKADGTIDIAAVNAWTSSDPSVGVEPGTESFTFDDGANGVVTCPGTFNCWALTPGLSGSGSITSKIAGYTDVEFQITYAEGVPLSQNPSVGTPVTDVPAV